MKVALRLCMRSVRKRVFLEKIIDLSVLEGKDYCGRSAMDHAERSKKKDFIELMEEAIATARGTN